MAFTTAQLVGAITASQTQFGLQNVSVNQSGLPVVGAPPLPVGYPMQIDTEFMFVISQPVAGTVIVRGRGSDNSAAISHDILANVISSSSPGDFANPQQSTTSTIDPSDDATIAIGQDVVMLASAVPGANTIFNINKASACLITLPVPSLQDNGVVLVFTSNTPNAHIITATNLFQDGVGTVPHSTATYVAKAGATMTLVIQNGFYNVQALQNVTIS